MNLIQLVEILRAEVLKDLNRERVALHVHETIANILKEKWAGKKITKRLEAHVKAAFPNATVHYGLEYGQLNVSVWGLGTAEKYDERIRCFIGYDSDLGEYKPEVFEDRDACHGSAAAKRIAEREALISEEGSKRLYALANAKFHLYNAEYDYKTALENCGDAVRYTLDKVKVYE